MAHRTLLAAAVAVLAPRASARCDYRVGGKCMVLVMLLLYLKVTRAAPRAPDPAAEELRAPPSPGAAPPPPPAWISAPPKERASEIELPLANGTDPNVSTLI